MKWKLLLLFTGILLLRIFFISSDIPSVRITEHTETDQYYYTLPSQNQLIYDSWYSELPPHNESLRVLFDVFQNLWTATFFTLFGFNLISFKLAVISIFLLSTFLLYKLFSITSINEKWTYLMLLFFGIEFMTFSTSMVQNPTVYSLFSACFALYLVANWINNSNTVNSLLLGISSVFIVLLVYLFNSYLAAAVGSFVIIQFFFEKNKKQQFIFFVVGIFIGIALCTGITKFLFDKTIVDLYNNLVTFSGGDSLRVVDQLNIPIIQKIKSFVGGFFLINIYRFNLFIIPVLLLSMTWSVLRFKKDKWARFYLMIFLFVLVQYYFEPRHAQKKLTVLLPFILHSGYFAFQYFSNSQFKVIKFIATGASVLGLLFGLYAWKMMTADCYEAARWGENTPQWFNGINLLFLFLAVILIVLHFWKPSSFYKRLTPLFLLPSTLLIVFYYGVSGTKFMSKIHVSEELKESNRMAGDYVESLCFNGMLAAFPTYLEYETSPEEYERDLFAKIESSEIQSVSFIRNKKFPEGYSFEDRLHMGKVLNEGDTMINLNNKYILVDQVVKLSQGKELYLGLSRNK